MATSNQQNGGGGGCLIYGIIFVLAILLLKACLGIETESSSSKIKHAQEKLYEGESLDKDEEILLNDYYKWLEKQ